MTDKYDVNEVLCAGEPSESSSASDEQEFRNLYEQQQRRLSCPSCGEEPFID